ncbi:hypothetical protein [Pseudomonas sp. Sample_22]|uniref:hypothetical protein n=1 Tax=Pseudomonas sp. Sample_22 TaxID=2448266 RepID=UPI0010328AD7|nr:hypothetical protein [Pseudomonas sp. Sample_22]
MKQLLLALIGLLLSACATEAKYQNMLSALQGIEELSLIRRWGPPDEVYESQGHRFLTYNHNQSVMLPGAEPIYQSTLSGDTVYTRGYGGYPPTIVTLSCVTTFEIVDSKIVSSSYHGDNCRAN